MAVLNGPCYPCMCHWCWGDVVFPVYDSVHGGKMGEIRNHWRGYMDKACDADTYGVSFPEELLIQHKVFFITILYVLNFLKLGFLSLFSC